MCIKKFFVNMQEKYCIIFTLHDFMHVKTSLFKTKVANSAKQYKRGSHFFHIQLIAA